MKYLITFVAVLALTVPAIAGTKKAAGDEGSKPAFYYNEETNSAGAHRHTLYVAPEYQKQAPGERGPWCQFENREGASFSKPVARDTTIDLTQKKFYVDYDKDGDAGRISMKRVEGSNLWATDWITDQPVPGNVHVCWLEGSGEECAYLYISPDAEENPTPGFVNGQVVDGLYARKGLSPDQQKAGVKKGDGIIVPIPAVTTAAKK